MVKWTEEGESNSKFFLSYKKQSSNNIKEIKTKYGLNINRGNAILGEMLNFYQDLYTRKNIQNENIQSYLSQIMKFLSLDYDDTQLLELHVYPSYEECKEAVNKQKRKSSLGQMVPQENFISVS